MQEVVRNWGRWDPAPWDGVPDPLTPFCPTYVTMPNSVSLGQRSNLVTVWAYAGSRKKLGALGSSPLGWGARPTNTILPHVCYHAEFGRSRSTRMDVGMGVPLLMIKASLTPVNTPLSHMSYTSNYANVRTEIRRKNLAPRVPPVEVT